MKPRVPLSTMELKCIDAIVNRACVHFPDREKRDVMMDIITVHLIHPIRLQDLLDTDDFNFIHDVVGIEHHLDRRTFTLRNGFSPRFSEVQGWPNQ